MATAQPHDLKRLQEEQADAVRATLEKVSKLESFKTDYQSLKQRLKTLPEKVTHDVMVPFGHLAFMPGHLMHTNEITVLLGDNWFVERSARQATDILSRRMQGLDEQIANMNKQLDLLTPRLDFTSQLQDLNQAKGDRFEITEEFDEEKEKLWKEQHRKNVRQHRSKKSTPEKKKTENADEDVWLRLEQLHMQERRNREMANMASNEDSETHLSNKIQQMMEAELGGEEEEEESEEESEEEAVQTINFSHSRISPDSNTSSEIISPSDVYAKFCSPKSILKSSEKSSSRRRSSVTFKDEAQEREEEVIPKTIQPANAFCGSVTERVLSDDPVSQPTASTSEEKPAKVSRFKQQRMKQTKS